jgi:hypothetical protein
MNSPTTTKCSGGDFFNTGVSPLGASLPVNTNYLSWENGFIINSNGISAEGTLTVAAQYVISGGNRQRTSDFRLW